MLLAEISMGFCVLNHHMEAIAVAAPVKGAQPLVNVAVGDHGQRLSMPADWPLFGIKLSELMPVKLERPKTRRVGGRVRAASDPRKPDLTLENPI
ncbi:hypothetical protein PSTG_02762 [Puccinia striiformis f. sp. tritici PST-78]|uniref:Uncharacterized protein n=1 Tax=Puccinia striiformis f. sp. tritici PST-78 TaxID=1165861 RepID=A0A0L0VYI0_9BASI|nr:hypothetical protein PSTG_02762 [Puccinia striiformis f. sp. tritici PST-78]